MRDYRIVEKWYNELNERFPDWSEDTKRDLAVTIYDELDYILIMGCHRPGGLFEKLKLPSPENKPAGIVDFDFIKFL